MSFRDFIAEHRRFYILRLLREIGGSANEDVLQQGIRRGFRPLQGVTKDAVRRDAEWLRERHLVAFDWLDDLLVVELTERGGDVLSGVVRVEGLSRSGRGV
ncbi:hypothetical protein [Neomegalonema sp.]|uniref:VpaChn25_0724 family phage protein n=1 Tax=Neomegalonema sp. TaxID=2039713 RepID=UPI0026371CA8|nr:hypothetical protein [Neomegalonema sp.]MDD2870098.1 hypothetical protein [Neomegalonema sp.]